MFREDYAKFRALDAYDNAEWAMEHVEDVLDAGYELVGDPDCLEIVKTVKDDIKPALTAAMAKVEEVYDLAGPDTDEMEDAIETMRDVCDMVYMAMDALARDDEKDFDISGLTEG